MTIRVFTMFSGYDSQCMALDRLKEKHPQFDYELVGWAEIDKYAISAHNAVYPQYADRNFGDVCSIDWARVPEFDLLTYSSPCQDFSQIGTQKGGAQDSGTRSSLLWQVERAIKEKRPRWCVMENVAALASDKFAKQFNAWQALLQANGYSNFAKRINAKDYVPQNRERLYMVSIKDCDAAYYFPTSSAHVKSLRDIYEKQVPLKYYVDYDFCVDDLEPILLGWSRPKTGNDVKRYAVQVANCVTANKHNNTQNYVLEVAQYRLRKLTERECFRLMGVCDSDIDKIIKVVNRTQCNKMAGNSIVVDVLAAIFEQLFFPNKKQYQQLEIF